MNRGATLDGLIGRSIAISKTITEKEVIAFAEISLDSHPNHLDEAYAKANGLGGCVVQGALLVGLMAGAGTAMLQSIGRPAVSYGYDRLRFLRGVHLGETVTATYTITKAINSKSNCEAEVRITNSARELVAVAIHIAHFTG